MRGVSRHRISLMYSDSRKTARNSFAHHRAHLLFAPKLISNEGKESPTRLPSILLGSRAAIVRNGLIGFVGAA